MALSVYIHIPYCLQRCRYCDFTTFEWRDTSPTTQPEIPPPETYVQWLLQELRNRRQMWSQSEIQTVYFGGGTPSLLAPELIVAIYAELANVGFWLRTDAEVTIEINPATVNARHLEIYLEAGLNRFSVGAQTFNDSLLRTCGRRHSAEDTRETLRLLRQAHANYSFDLLFALPGQTRDDLERDLDEVAKFAPPHLSAYCLTVPEGHPMSRGRPPEDDQVEMFAHIETHLGVQGLRKYEISNFARPGFESRHNQAYWKDEPYWGLGLSSHSYDPDRGPFGTRFWNSKSFREYSRAVERCTLDPEQMEQLQAHEAATDLCHMFLRTTAGLSIDAVLQKFTGGLRTEILNRLARLSREDWLTFCDQRWRLTSRGELISNKVFEELTFLQSEIGLDALTQTSPDP
ncbi:MAG: radical SAM family heme chaperone HemW [Bdellovibrionales bacterium]